MWLACHEYPNEIDLMVPCTCCRFVPSVKSLLGKCWSNVDPTSIQCWYPLNIWTYTIAWILLAPWPPWNHILKLLFLFLFKPLPHWCLERQSSHKFGRFSHANICLGNWNGIHSKNPGSQNAYRTTSRWYQICKPLKIAECSSLLEIETNINLMVQVEERLLSLLYILK
jgi:hypothetical protein